MTEYIIKIPDEYFASYDTKRDMYYPAELDNAMPITPFVRCRDCARFVPQGTYRFNDGTINKDTCEVIRGFVVQINPDGFCAWGEREMNNKTGDFVTHDAHADDYKQAAEYWQKMYEQTFAERTCHIEHPHYGDVPVINGQPRCSECKTEFAVGTFPNYCPNCGAKMVDE